jgi:ergothioneine biosynthesis protein EgtB
MRPTPEDVHSSSRALQHQLAASFRDVRSLTEQLCAPLAIEDFGMQSMPDASPAKWHLAHTTWFFETFVLADGLPGYCPFHPQFGYLFNSYYNAMGAFWPREQRGLLSRPTVAEVFRYRRHVDAAIVRLLCAEEGTPSPSIRQRIVLGLNHEQQHQELLLTDLKHAFASSPLRPVYRERHSVAALPVAPLHWQRYPAGLRWIGHEGSEFTYDNEGPRHRVFLEPFQLAMRLVTSGEFRAFIDAGGYQRSEFWLSDGWAARRAEDWQAPLYWERYEDSWFSMTLAGLQPVQEADPVCHVSYYEADAYARWAGARLPTEAEWETAAAECPLEGSFLNQQELHPRPVDAARADARPTQMFGEVWQWTASPYSAYPGYRPLDGALGEYNGKFMCNQMVLRGGSCATPRSHFRRSYRNFFPPQARWQFTGIRLAKDS